MNTIASSKINDQSPILLFDGVCNLCNGFIQFIIKRDKEAVFRFASLQSSVGQTLLKDYHLPTDSVDTVVLIEDRKSYTRSTVPLRIAKRLGGLWSLLYVFILIPPPIRDFIYNWIAKNRYKWFGKEDQCMIPTPDLKKRFLDNA